MSNIWKTKRIQKSDKNYLSEVSSSSAATKSKLNSSLFLTYSGPVLPNQPQMVAKEGQNTDAEHGCHKEKEQDVEFGVSVRQLVLEE